MRKLLVLVVAAVCVCCSSSKDLSRGNARDLVEKQFKDGSTVEFRVNWQAIQQGKDADEDTMSTVRAGLWELVDRNPANPQDRSKIIRLTPKGQKYFLLYVPWPDGPAVLTSKFTIRPDVSVTGITDGALPSSKVVLYTLTWHNNYPSEVGAIGSKEWTNTGRLAARLYDDGWRVEH